METNTKKYFVELYKDNSEIMDKLSEFFICFLKHPNANFFCNLPSASDFTGGEEGWLFRDRWVERKSDGSPIDEGADVKFTRFVSNLAGRFVVDAGAGEVASYGATLFLCNAYVSTRDIRAKFARWFLYYTHRINEAKDGN